MAVALSFKSFCCQESVEQFIEGVTPNLTGAMLSFSRSQPKLLTINKALYNS